MNIDSVIGNKSSIGCYALGKMVVPCRAGDGQQSPVPVYVGHGGRPQLQNVAQMPDTRDIQLAGQRAGDA